MAVSTSALSPRRWPRPAREAAVVAACLPLAALAGAAVARLGAEFSVFKVVFAVAVFAAGLVAVSDSRLAAALIVVVAGLPFRTSAFLDVEVHPAHLLLLLVVGAGGVQVALGTRRVPTTLARATTIIAVSATIAALAGPDVGGSLWREVNGVLLPLAGAAVLAGALHPRRDAGLLIVGTAIALILTSLIAIGQTLGLVPPALAPTFGTDRVNGLFFHPNILAGYLAASVVLLVGAGAFAGRRTPFGPLLVVPAVLLGVGALILTQSRGGMVALAAGIVAITALMIARRRAAAVLAVVAVGAIAATYVVPQLPESQRAQFVERFRHLQQPGAETGRKSVYTAAEQQIRAHPITGVGTMTFRKIINDRSTVPGLEANLGHAHNIALEAWLSLGLFGMLALAWIWAGAMLRYVKVSRRGDGLDSAWAVGATGALVTMLVQGLADVVFWQVEMFVLLTLLIAVAYARSSGP